MSSGQHVVRSSGRDLFHRIAPIRQVRPHRRSLAAVPAPVARRPPMPRPLAELGVRGSSVATWAGGSRLAAVRQGLHRNR